MPDEVGEADLRIVVVGPCGAGKSTLAENLSIHGYSARQVTQEHSYVPNMWKLLSKPHILIYLDASFEACTLRKRFNWRLEEFAEQIRRLSHARQHCDIYLLTDDLSPEEILQSVLQSLQTRR
jgi:deoxyadenosine/deoxycytidine kinase